MCQERFPLKASCVTSKFSVVFVKRFDSVNHRTLEQLVKQPGSLPQSETPGSRLARKSLKNRTRIPPQERGCLDRLHNEFTENQAECWIS